MTLRLIACVTLRDHKKHIWKECDRMPDAVRWTRCRRLQLREHVERINHQRITKIVQIQKPGGVLGKNVGHKTIRLLCRK